MDRGRTGSPAATCNCQANCHAARCQLRGCQSILRAVVARNGRFRCGWCAAVLGVRRDDVHAVPAVSVIRSGKTGPRKRPSGIVDQERPGHHQFFHFRSQEVFRRDRRCMVARGAMLEKIHSTTLNLGQGFSQQYWSSLPSKIWIPGIVFRTFKKIRDTPSERDSMLSLSLVSCGFDACQRFCLI